MTEAMVIPQVQPDLTAIESALMEGDLSSLTVDQRLMYYRAKCESLGLNPLTQPFQYLKLNGKLVLYAKKDAKEQLRKMHGISLKIIEQFRQDDLYMVRVEARDRDGRVDEDVGFAVVAKNLTGDALGNAILKAVTKAKSRVTLSICGLGDLDESEVDSIPGAIVREDLITTPLTQRVALAPSDAVEIHPTMPTAGKQKVPISQDVVIPKGLPCEGVKLAALRPSQVEMVLRKVELLHSTQGEKWSVLLQTLRSHGKEKPVGVAQEVKTTTEDDVPTHSSTEPQGESFSAEATHVGDEPSSSTTGQSVEPERQIDDTHETDMSEAVAGGPDIQTATKSDGMPGGSGSEGKKATPQQVARLKLLAQQVGDEAYADVQDVIDHHPDGLPEDVYKVVRERLLIRQSEAKAKASPQGEL